MDQHVVRGLPEYTAYRISLDRDDTKVDALFEGFQYVRGFEVSVAGEPHYHIMLYGKPSSCLLKRWQRFDAGRAKKWSKINYKADFLKGISYTVKCNDFAIFGEEMEYWVPRAPKWVFAAKDRLDPQVAKPKYFGYRTLVPMMREFAKVNSLEHKTFKEVFTAMLKHNYRADEYMAHRGIPQEFIKEWDRPADEFAEDFYETMIQRGRTRYAPY